MGQVVDKMAYEYWIIVQEKEKIEIAIEKIYTSFKSNELYKNVIKEKDKLVLPYNDPIWDRWFELEKNNSEIYYWVSSDGIQRDLLIKEISDVLNKLNLTFTIEEE
ncbi:hypothetical protein ACIQ57_23445 [Lysinibacillus xylanilyticus]|uniref:hypothetical protein n=1 Tax=Lysinibacillus xylanilyticus TaxID=582475 RepID=UPI0037FA2361